MGPISSKLRRRFMNWRSEFQQNVKSIHIPKDARDVRQLVKNGYDPLHAVYICVQNLASVFAESVSSLSELKPYAKVIGAAEDEYMPQGPPMSPLTRSYFTSWAFFDLRFGPGLETIGTCLRDLGDLLGLQAGMVDAIGMVQESRMGIYEHMGNQGRRVRLRELVTGRDFDALCTSGYPGEPGELWYARLCPPVADLVDYHVIVTTPYVLTGTGTSDWTAYLNRAMLQLDRVEEPQRLHGLLKYGLSLHHWNEFVLQAYHHHQHDAVFLAGLPDVKSSLPHADLATEAAPPPKPRRERRKRPTAKRSKAKRSKAKSIPTPPGEPRMSEVILEVAEPLVRKYAGTPEDAKHVIMLVVQGWNISLFPADKRPMTLKKILSALAALGGNPELMAAAADILDTTAKRRRKLFPHVRKLVVDHQVTISGDDFNLNVSSAPLRDDWES